MNNEFDNKLNAIKQKVDNFSVNKGVPTDLLHGDLNALKNTEFTLVIPTYKRSDTFKQALTSLCTQPEFNNICVLVIDNADKNDNSCIENLEFVKRVGYENILYFSNSKNLGMVGNWNRAIELARSKYVCFLHDDDLVSDGYIAEITKCVENAEKYSNNKVGVIKVKTNVFYDEESLMRIKPKNAYRGGVIPVSNEDFLIGHVHVSNPPTCGMVFSRKALIECGGFNSLLYPSMDELIGVQMFDLGYSAFITEDVLGYYRFAINESLKPETMRGFCENEYVICAYSASLSEKLTRFWNLFGKSSYTANIQYYFNFAKNNGNKQPFKYFDSYGFSTIANRIGAYLILAIQKLIQSKKTREVIY